MASNMTFKANLNPQTDYGFELGSFDTENPKRWKINGVAGSPVEYITGTQTAATASWAGVTNDSTLVTGKMIAYKLPVASKATATLQLTFTNPPSGGATQTAAIPVYLNTTRVGTHYGAGSVVIMVYDGTNWRSTDYWDGNTNTLLRTYSSATDLDVPLIGQNSAASITATWSSYTATYKDWYGAIPNDDTKRAKINLSTGLIKAPGGIEVSTINGVTVGESPKFTDTDTKVTSVDNHYTPSATATAELTATLSGSAGSFATNTEYTVLTGVKAQRDAKGHITGLTYTAQKVKDTTVANTDTKQNIVLNTTTKAYVTGVTTATSNVQALTGIADTGVYLTATAGELSAVRHSYNVSGAEKAYTMYNNTTNAIDFVFA